MTFYLLDLSCQVNCHCGNFVDHLNVYSTGYHEQFEGNIFDVKRREECFFFELVTKLFMLNMLKYRKTVLVTRSEEM